MDYAFSFDENSLKKHSNHFVDTSVVDSAD